jgi:hypothetical protein
MFPIHLEPGRPTLSLFRALGFHLLHERDLLVVDGLPFHIEDIEQGGIVTEDVGGE